MRWRADSGRLTDDAAAAEDSAPASASAPAPTSAPASAPTSASASASAGDARLASMATASARSADAYSVQSNPPSWSSCDNSTRALAHREIAAHFFGSMSRVGESSGARDDAGDDAGEELVASSRSDSSAVMAAQRARGRTWRAGKRPRVPSDPHYQEPHGEESAAERPTHLTTGFVRQSSLPSDDRPRRRESAQERARRRSNCEVFQDLVHLANTQQPVDFDVFRDTSSRRRRKTSSLSARALEDLSARGRKSACDADTLHEAGESEQSSSDYRDSEDSTDPEDDELDPRINTELLEAYIAYSKSIGHEPNIQIGNYHDSSSDDSDDGRNADPLGDPRASYVQHRPVVEEKEHLWTGVIGTRFSKRRGCVQFWTWMMIGVAVVVILGISLSNLKLNEVLHLDAFVERDVVVTEDYTYLYLQDEVNFHLKYDLEAGTSGTNDSHFMVLIMYDDDFDNYVDGKEFKYKEKGSTLRTTYASLPLTYIDDVEDEMYLVIQPCVLARNPDADYCQTSRLPTPVSSRQKVYNLGQPKFMAKHTGPNYFPFTYMYVNPMPDNCADSGFRGTAYLLLFVPYVAIVLFGLRLVQMMLHCESFRASLERAYKKEFDVPENEVDYWQPMPWDRKVPKTRLLGPCCWRKFRRPFEPFYTWWRHENYFTWVFCPYRNERLSRSERAIIVACSLYITFYVLFLIVMLRDSVFADISIFSSVVVYAILISVLPSAGKAVFKELFKLIFRQRRKYFRTKAAGGDVSQFSFRLAFVLQVLVAVLITLAQAPIYYIWLRRSCLFLTKFMYFGMLAAVMRLSIMGLVQDFAWYLIIKTWGWKDLCPYCTERIVHCDCFNDELLVLAVERVGPKWELIAVLDKVLAKSKGYEAQFELYTPDQLRERWGVIVARAEKHMEKLEKLRAYREKKRQDRLRRHRQQRRSFLGVSTLLGFHDTAKSGTGDLKEGESRENPTRFSDEDDVHDTDTNSNKTSDEDEELDSRMCSLREKKILAVNAKVHLEKFEKHYDSTIVDVFRSLAHAVTRHVPRLERADEESDRGDGSEQEPPLPSVRGAGSVSRHRSHREAGETRALSSRPDAAADAEARSPAGSSEGETMWLFTTPAERLERREREKLQRKQAFRVLRDYEIETVEARRDEQGHVVYVAPSPAAPPAPRPSPPSSAPVRAMLARFDSMHRPLLGRQRSEPTEDDIVVVASDVPDLAITIVDDTYDGNSSSDEEQPSVASVGGGARRLSRSRSRSRRSNNSASASTSAGGGDARPAVAAPLSSSAVAPPPSSRAYSVVPRRQTLMRRVSASAAAFANWALRYDTDGTAKY